MLLTPHLIVPDVTHIKPAWLDANGIKGFIFDLDNTLMRPHTGQLDPHVADWLADIRDRGYGCSVISNNPITPYIQQVEQVLGFRCLSKARKPRRAGLLQGLQWLGLPAHQVVVVGDRPLTDIWGGNRIGAKTILVDPLNKANEGTMIRWLRRMERLVIRQAISS
jgi:uncharacterized protein